MVAQITNRGAESYTLSLFSAHSATLPALSFEGATKRHKPNLRIGALVYARIVSADRFTEPELTCLNPVTAKSDGFGELKTHDERGEKNGHAMLFRISLGLARRYVAQPQSHSRRREHRATPPIAWPTSEFEFESMLTWAHWSFLLLWLGLMG